MIFILRLWEIKFVVIYWCKVVFGVEEVLVNWSVGRGILVGFIFYKVVIYYLGRFFM